MLCLKVTTLPGLELDHAHSDHSTNGSNGINGVNGTNGLNGKNGVNGTNGLNGHSQPHFKLEVILCKVR
jgi:hypothetical protein